MLTSRCQQAVSGSHEKWFLLSYYSSLHSFLLRVRFPHTLESGQSALCVSITDGALRSVRLRVELSQSVGSASGRMFGNVSELSDDLFGCAALLASVDGAGGEFCPSVRDAPVNRHNGTKAQKKNGAVPKAWWQCKKVVKVLIGTCKSFHRLRPDNVIQRT